MSKQPTIGGSVFIRNAIQYDYCIIEAIESLRDLCDEIVVLDCESDDGTLNMLSHRYTGDPKVKLHTGAKWECAPNYERLSKLANQAIEMLCTDWHFMIQADEVLHEDSIPLIRSAICAAPPTDSIAVRRRHIWGDMDHQIRHDIPHQRKPAGDRVIRIGRKWTRAHGDGENLLPKGHTFNLAMVSLFHYGFVRRNEVQKVIDMQSWFHGPGAQPDERVVKMRDENGGVFDPNVFFKPEELCKIPLSHPKVAQTWVNERRSLWQNTLSTKALIG